MWPLLLGVGRLVVIVGCVITAVLCHILAVLVGVALSSVICVDVELGQVAVVVVLSVVVYLSTMGGCLLLLLSPSEEEDDDKASSSGDECCATCLHTALDRNAHQSPPASHGRLCWHCAGFVAHLHSDSDLELPKYDLALASLVCSNNLRKHLDAHGHH
jgi:hypothetical protein